MGKPLLEIQIDRVNRSLKIDKLIVATSVGKDDEGIVDLCQSLNTECFRGELDDVLDRFYQASVKYEPEHIVRLTGDCPLIDPDLIDKLIDFYLAGSYDYASNCHVPTYPNGLDAEIMSFSALKTSWLEATLPSHREHVTLFIRQQPDIFAVGSLEGKTDLSDHRWTVDEPEDFELVKIIYESLYPENNNFAFKDILDFVAQNPELSKINQGFKRNEGLIKSQKLDRLFKGEIKP